MYTFICTFDLKGVHFEKVYIVKNKYRFLSSFACTFICSEKNVTPLRSTPFSFPTKNVSALALFYRWSTSLFLPLGNILRCARTCLLRKNASIFIVVNCALTSISQSRSSHGSSRVLFIFFIFL